MGFGSKHPGRQPKDLSKKSIKFKTLFLIICFLIFISTATAAGLAATDNPDFCASCHEMRPEYYTWKVTAHHNVSCVSCHREPGLSNLFKFKAKTAWDIYAHFTGFERPITLKGSISDDACSRCHSFNREYTPSGDIIIPHDLHKAQKVSCVSCHAGLVHGKIAQREATKEGDLAAWTSATGEKETPLKYTRPAMSTCMECHYQKKVHTPCEACHQTISLPSDHLEPKWLKEGQHGLEARQDLASCDRCHSYSIEMLTVATQDKVARYGRINSFCTECHLTLPASHGSYWLMNHKDGVRAKGRANCVVCHNEELVPQEERASAVYCSKCHRDDLHPEGWLRKHPKVVKDEGITPKGCFDCHDKAQCSSCHTNPAMKPF